jgi:putative transposase
MARPLRIEYSGALYHVTSRGNARGRIFEANTDRKYFLDLLGFVVKRFHWLCHTYCLMDNHYHLIIETPEGNLSKGMRQLNGIYTQKYNWKYKKTGHVFQGRYKAILVDKDSYLLELCRYVVLNPVKARMVESPKEWLWSSYLSTIGSKKPPESLTIDWILGQFGKNKRQAQNAYERFVMEGISKEPPWKSLQGQIFLGDKQFIENSKDVLAMSKDLSEIPRSQKYAGRPPLSDLLTQEVQLDKTTRKKAVFDAHCTYGYTLKAIADYLDIHYTTVSKIVKRAEGIEAGNREWRGTKDSARKESS